MNNAFNICGLSEDYKQTLFKGYKIIKTDIVDNDGASEVYLTMQNLVRDCFSMVGFRNDYLIIKIYYDKSIESTIVNKVKIRGDKGEFYKPLEHDEISNLFSYVEIMRSFQAVRNNNGRNK